jgi:hypothetical protein
MIKYYLKDFIEFRRKKKIIFTFLTLNKELKNLGPRSLKPKNKA